MALFEPRVELGLVAAHMRGRRTGKRRVAETAVARAVPERARDVRWRHQPIAAELRRRWPFVEQEELPRDWCHDEALPPIALVIASRTRCSRRLLESPKACT